MIERRFSKESSAFLAVALLLTVVGVASVDVLLNSDISVLPLYVAPIMVMAWARPGRAWLLLAVFAGAAWACAQAVDRSQDWATPVLIWNALGRLTVFACIGLLTSLVVYPHGWSDATRFDASGLLSHDGFLRALDGAHPSGDLAAAPSAVLLLNIECSSVGSALARRERAALLAALLAGVMRERAREGDLLVRLNDFDFAVVMPRTESDQAQKVAGTIVDALPQIRRESGQQFQATSVLGWSDTLPARSQQLMRDSGRALITQKVTAPGTHGVIQVGPAPMAGMLAT